MSEVDIVYELGLMNGEPGKPKVFVSAVLERDADNCWELIEFVAHSGGEASTTLLDKGEFDGFERFEITDKDVTKAQAARFSTQDWVVLVVATLSTLNKLLEQGVEVESVAASLKELILRGAELKGDSVKP